MGMPQGMSRREALVRRAESVDSVVIRRKWLSVRGLG